MLGSSGGVVGKTTSLIFLRSSKDILPNELLDITEVSAFADGIVMVTIRKLFPDRCLRLAQSEELFHMRWTANRVSVINVFSDLAAITYGTISSCKPLRNRIGISVISGMISSLFQYS